MPREARNIKPLTSYHIMVQGINKEHIFSEDRFKKKYLSILKKQLDIYNIKMISYCIMINHAHLLLYSEDRHSISSLMHMVNSIYSMYYNETMQRVGFVFRDRFLSQEIYDYNQLKICINYIHNNPVKSNLVKRADLYYFSSYNEYYTENSKYIDFSLISNIFRNHDIKDIWNVDNSLKFNFIEPNYYDRDLFYMEVVNKIRDYRIFKDKAVLKRFLIQCKEKYCVPNKEIASILGVSNTTVGTWLHQIESSDYGLQ